MKSLLMAILTLLLFNTLFAKECVVTMGYKPKSKPPFIFDDNSGIYRDVYGEALNRIGCRLKVVRMPKLRIIKELKKGTIDFYPALGFTAERAAFVSFIFSNINHDNVLITRKDYPHIDGIPDLISLKPTLLKEVGGYSLLEGIPAKRFETTDMNINNNMKLLINRRIDAFSYPLKVVEYYLKIHPEVVNKVRIYRDFFRKNQQRHTFGFSIFSKYSKIKNNRNFNPFKPVSRTNIPNVLDENSIAYKFSESLNKMYKDGEIENIYKKYRIEEQ